ncbi:TolC family protein [Campylobacter sp. 2018MI27]|uniref:TolC family protein n=1 Tax=Campylobacter sp. 2018MI27 TaxID=2836738 RepID=UPI001BD9CD47|nr:TolC family protein [Campylobacter sp. 2018MI27]MBT0881021.1 TolC family protein [Campylobacter sp. 2018MI27]
MKKLSLILLSLSLLNATSLKTMLESIENNEQLKAKNYETLSKEESAKSVKYKYYPSATLQVGFVSFDYDRYIINPNNLTNVSLAIDALIYDGKRNSNINLAKKNHELSQIELEKAKNELEFNLASLYLALIHI